MSDNTRAALAVELDRHWLTLDHHGPLTARCTCGGWEIPEDADIPSMGERLLPFSEHVADALLAARAEGLDVERLARAMHDQGFGCNAYRCSLGRGSSADAHEQDARFLADAYREADR